MQRTIHVTQEDISSGLRRSSGSCPIAKAIRRCLVGVRGVRVWGVQVGGGQVCLAPEGIPVWLRLPEEAQKFINAFDSGQEVLPFTFYLDTTTLDTTLDTTWDIAPCT